MLGYWQFSEYLGQGNTRPPGKQSEEKIVGLGIKSGKLTAGPTS